MCRKINIVINGNVQIYLPSNVNRNSIEEEMEIAELMEMILSDEEKEDTTEMTIQTANEVSYAGI